MALPSVWQPGSWLSVFVSPSLSAPSEHWAGGGTSPAHVTWYAIGKAGLTAPTQTLSSPERKTSMPFSVMLTGYACRSVEDVAGLLTHVAGPAPVPQATDSL